MKPHALLSTVLAMTCLVTTAEADTGRETRRYQASAYDLEEGFLLYLERHTETWSDGRLSERRVRYEDADGELIAEKTVTYAGDRAAPSFEMTDYRIGLRESALVKQGEVELYSGEPNAASRSRVVALPDLAVIDAGFDVFMRDRFAEIIAGNRLEFDFAVPAARRFFKFQLIPKGTVEYEGQEAVLVQMKPASRLLSLVLDPIDLVYDRAGRLLEFRGLSNVCNESGDRYKARIVFDYPRDETVATELDLVLPVAR